MRKSASCTDSAGNLKKGVLPPWQSLTCCIQSSNVFMQQPQGGLWLLKLRGCKPDWRSWRGPRPPPIACIAVLLLARSFMAMQEQKYPGKKARETSKLVPHRNQYWTDQTYVMSATCYFRIFLKSAHVGKILHARFTLMHCSAIT